MNNRNIHFESRFIRNISFCGFYLPNVINQIWGENANHVEIQYDFDNDRLIITPIEVA